MKTNHHFLTLTLLLAVVSTAVCQPIITNQPEWQTNLAGTTATFSVGATGTPPLAYQWRKSSSALAGQTNAALVLTNVQMADQTIYSVVITNSEGSVTSAIARLYVLLPPIITLQPVTNQSVSVGANVQLLVSATSTHPPLRYQWQFAATNLPAQTNALLNLTNAQPGYAGDYDAVVADSVGSVTSHLAHLEVDATFTKITTGRIVTDEWNALGCAWGDYDNDGFIDLIITSGNAPANNVLFHNDRDGTFTRITNTLTTAEARDWRGCAWADYDNDGNLDLFVTSTDANHFSAENELFRNNGNGTFTKMTRNNAGDLPSLAAGGSEGCIWADYDNDGFLDMFVAQYGPDWLIHNNGDGTFVRMTNSIPPDNQDKYFAAWGDYNNDGRPDLFVTAKSDPPTNRLYLNLGGGSFAPVTSGSMATNRAHSFGCAWGDYDNDGHLDLFISNGGYGAIETNFLYHNNGNGAFTKMTSAMVGSVASDASHFGPCAWGDYDNDGFLDLFVTDIGDGVNAGANFLYHNNGDGTFTRVLSGSLVNDKGFAGGCAWGDYDNDGFLDLFVALGLGGTPAANLLYRNNGNSNAWVKIKLVGTASNRSAIGAKVRVQATIRGRFMWQMREVNTGDGFSAGPLEVRVGLSDATNIDTLRIEWPSGIVQMMTNVAPKQFLTVVEHQDLGLLTATNFTTVSRSANGNVDLSAAGDSGLLYVFEASTNLVNWTKVGVRSNATGLVRFTDTKATNYAHRFYRVSIP